MPLITWVFSARQRTVHKLVLCGVAVVLIYFLYLHKHRSLTEPTEPIKPSYRIPVRKGAGYVADENSAVIPRVLHQTWKGHDVPETMRPWMKSWLEHNPALEYWFWTDEDMRELIRLKFPAFLSFYDSYPGAGYRADAFRYFVLYSHGGIYADIDMACVRPLDDLLASTDCIVAQEPIEHAHFLSTMGPPLVSNALMACRPHHPFFHNIIHDLKSFAGFWSWRDVIKATGPDMLTEVYRGYHHGSWLGLKSVTHPVTLADPVLFNPSPDESMVPRMQEMCLYSQGKDLLSDKFSRRQAELCDKLATYQYGAGVDRRAYTVHHWTHTWAGDRNDPWGIHGQSSQTFNIAQLDQT